eukprot:scaffold147341_cov22-Tisochrysis_lutea.AAC.2
MAKFHWACVQGDAACAVFLGPPASSKSKIHPNVVCFPLHVSVTHAHVQHGAAGKAIAGPVTDLQRPPNRLYSEPVDITLPFEQ